MNLIDLRNLLSQRLEKNLRIAELREEQAELERQAYHAVDPYGEGEDMFDRVLASEVRVGDVVIVSQSFRTVNRAETGSDPWYIYLEFVEGKARFFRPDTSLPRLLGLVFPEVPRPKGT